VEFDVFNFNEVTDGHALKYVGMEMSIITLLPRFKVSFRLFITPTSIFISILILNLQYWLKKSSILVPVLAMEAFLAQLEVDIVNTESHIHNLVHAADICQTNMDAFHKLGFWS